MQSARAGAEIDIPAFGIVRQRLRAVPQTRAAVTAFLEITWPDDCRFPLAQLRCCTSARSLHHDL
jgi:hypothetical protein